MALSPGTHIGPYEVTALIGEGGMGKVWRARHTGLKRDDALKVLPDAFASDPNRLARFQREAQVLASLNHPNIAHVYGLEQANPSTGSGQAGVQALVMELVEGPTLADRIARGAIPVDEALPIAKQIAEALEAAHEQGIIHRDLKPANIKVRDDGTVKVLDFGLAKALGPPEGGHYVQDGRSVRLQPDLTASPTITSPAMMTGVGVLLGTAAYMSPEQARGKAVDKRSDIWAFGCVLYEMLTGRRAFGRGDVTDTLATILRDDPDWDAPSLLAAPVIRKLVRRCLRKDPRQRLADIADARLDIQEASEAATTAPHIQRGVRLWYVLPWAVTVVSLLAFAVLALRTGALNREASAINRVTRLEVNMPRGVELYTGVAQSAAVSPDGAVLAFIGVRGALRQLYVRHLDQFEATVVPGTERATTVFFSPDGRAVGVITSDGTLMRVSLADSLVAPLTRDVYFGGGSWGPDDRMTFVGNGGLWQVPSSGGAPQQITKLDTSKGEILHAWPSVAAGNVILFSSVTGTRRDAVHVEALSLPSGRRHIVAESATRPMYAPSGHVVFVRDGAVLAAAFNAERLQMTGSPVRVLENVAVDDSGASMVGISASGSVVYATNQAGTSRLVWVSRQGVERTINDTPRRYGAPRLAPDGRSVVVLAEGDLWIQDTLRTTFTRLTTDDTSGNSYPVWAPDGQRVAFRTRTGIRLIDATGSGRVESLPGSNLFGDIPSSISPDGDTLAFVRQTGQGSGGSDVFVLSLSGKSEVRPVLQSPAFEGGPQFSPDGRWLAYVSNESGQFQVYVRPFSGPDRKWQVSTDGGTHPRWNSNGREIFYRNENKMMVATVTPASELTFSQPRVLFDQHYAFGTAQTIPNYDVSPDGLNFVMVKDDAEAGRLNVVLNWFEELKRLVPTN